MALFGFGRQGDGYGGSRGGGMSLRILAGLVIAGIALVTYFTRTQVNPVTGEKQHVALTVDQEKQLGLQAAPEMAAEMGGALDPRKDPDAHRVAEVGFKLVRQTEASKSPYVGNFDFYLLGDRNVINAFALPGGKVFITRALFDKLRDESELAGVLGHEVGHVINRHSAEQMAKKQRDQMLVVATGVGASDRGNRGSMAAAVAAVVAQMRGLSYSRSDESEADRYGLKLMGQAGYDPRGMLDVMQVLKQAGGGGRQPEWMLTHPLPENRFAEVKQIIAEQYPNGVPASLTRGAELHGGAGVAGGRRDERRQGADEKW
jgi:predicted Zn-dependent protease